MPSKKFYHDIDLQGSKLINVGPTNATIDSGLGSGGGSDPVLEARVEKLENQAASIIYSFEDTFADELLIDWSASSNVTRISIGGQSYVAINPSTVTSNANLQTDADGTSTTSVTYSGGAVSNVAGTQGVYTSNYYTINAATQAQINATFTAPTSSTFGDESVYSTSGMSANIINLYTVADNDRRWFFYQTAAGYGELYGWAINLSDGTTFMSHRRIGAAGPAGNITPSVYRSLSAKIDNAGNVWLACYRYIGGTAAANIRCAVYKITVASPTTDTFPDESRALVAASTITSIDTFYDSATDRFHAAYSTAGTNQAGAIVIYNGSSNTFLSQTSFSLAGTAPFNLRLVKSSAASKEVAIFATRSGTTIGVNGLRYTIDTALSYGQLTQTYITLSASSNGSADFSYDATHGFVGINIRSGGASCDFLKISPTFTTGSVATAFNNSALSPVAKGISFSSGVSDGTHFYLSYIANDTFDAMYTTKMRLTDGLSTTATNGFLHRKIVGFSTFANFNFDQPLMEFRNGTVSLFYDKNTNNASNIVGGVSFGTFPARIKVEAQMPTGNWTEVYNNETGYNVLTQSVTLATTKQTQIRFRATMTPANGTTNQSTVSQFTATVPGSNSTGTLVSKSLVIGKPVTRVTISPDLTLGDGSNGIDGTVSFQASNNAGVTWQSITSGTDVLFSSIGSDLRIKATINVPVGSTGFSPRIQGYGGTAGNIAQQSDLVIINVNLLKTSLQLNTLLTAQRYSWTNMMVDTFQNGDGVTLGSGISLSGGTITGTGVVTSATETADINPVNSVIVVAETDGIVTFEFSRDDGVTWHALNRDTLVTLDQGTVKNKLKLRATLTSGTLYGWAYLYA